MSALRFEAWPAGEETAATFDGIRGPQDPVEPVPVGMECLVAFADHAARARATLDVRSDLHGVEGPCGMIGHYAALDRDAGVALLREGAARLVARGATRVLGPMNGSTWARYRLALPPEAEDPAGPQPPFPGEPRNPVAYPEHFEAAGFRVASRYETRLDDLAQDPDDAQELAARVAEAGFSLRPLDLSRFEHELDTLFTLSLAAFADNWFYAPIDAATFRAQYEPMRSHIDPEFVVFGLDRDQQPCSYLFAFPDPTTLDQGRATRLVVKTVAVHPAARGRGLGHHMLDRVRWSARRRGLAAVLHALMHVENFSMRMSARHGGRLFRRYALYEWAP